MQAELLVVLVKYGNILLTRMYHTVRISIIPLIQSFPKIFCSISLISKSRNVYERQFNGAKQSEPKKLSHRITRDIFTQCITYKFQLSLYRSYFWSFESDAFKTKIQLFQTKKYPRWHSIKPRCCKCCKVSADYCF